MSELQKGTMCSEDYKKWFGLEKRDFEDLYEKFIGRSGMRDTSSRTKKEALGMFLLMLRKNLDQDTMGVFFGVSQSVVSDSIQASSKTLRATLVKENLGYQAMPRETALRNHN